MTHDRFAQLDALFRRALAIAPAERHAWLDDACPDPALRRDVEALLAEDAAPDGALDAAPGAPLATALADVAASFAAPVEEQPGARVGPYRILETIGEGGFGVVFMAEQQTPVVRRVALKIIKLGMDTRQVVARFEAERQALALMDHPHIATVLDGGATESGRPYFVMELCTGLPITEYCRTHELDLPARLELVGQVCRAVEHAHQKGVIHRDLKPGNILVETRDGRPFARVIDFGIAKATDARLTEHTYFTEHRQMIGTPEYMSPEQADAATDVDTRTDVYALGVLLYELLTGCTPIDGEALRSAAWGEMQHLIRNAQPVRPSTRRSDAGARGPLLPATSGARMRGELDWIVMKALEKDRGRRYQSARALADDLANHLAGRPVLAAPPSRLYLARSFVRRHRGGVTALTAIAAALLIGIAGTTWGLLAALDAGARAEQSAADATARADELAQVVRFQVARLADVDPHDVGERLRASIEAELDAHRGASAAPDDDRDRNLDLDRINFTNVALTTLREDILQRSIDAANDEFADRPLIRARLLQSIIEAAYALGLYDFADDPLQTALELRRDELGPHHLDTLESLYMVVLFHLQKGRFADAEAPARTVMEQRCAQLGDDADTVDAIGAYGAVLRQLGRDDEALPLYREALATFERVEGLDHPDRFVFMTNLGILLRKLGQPEESEQMLRGAYDGRRRTLGEHDARTLSAMLNLGYVLRADGRFDEAEPYYVNALAGHRAILGDEHATTLNSMNNTGVFFEHQGDFVRAEPYFQEATTTAQRILGPDHRTTLIYANNLAEAWIELDRLDDAEALIDDTIARSTANVGPDHRETLRHELSRALLAEARGDLRDAEAQLVTLHARAVERLGPDARDTADIARVIERVRDASSRTPGAPVTP